MRGEVDPHLFRFRMEKRVYWAEVDPQWIVFNANYLTYADIAFSEYMRALGLGFPNPLKDEGTDIFAVRSEVNWRSSARFDDVLTLLVRTARIGRSSFTIEVLMMRGPEVLADVKTTYANAADGQSVPLPETFIAAIGAYEAAPPER